MKKMLIVLVSFIALAPPSFGLDIAEWVRSTDRSANPEIIRLMSEGDLAQTLAVASALGARPDPYVADIVASYLSAHRNGRQYESERVLSNILSAVFPRTLSEAETAARLEANREAVSALVEVCEGFESAELRAACIRLGAASGQTGIGPLISREGGRLAARLQKNRGRVERAEAEEIHVIMDAIEKFGAKEFRSLLVDFARFSHDRRIVERARALSAALK